MLRINSWTEMKMLNAWEVGTLERSMYGNCFICLVGLDWNYLSIQMRLTECPKVKGDFIRPGKNSISRYNPHVGTQTQRLFSHLLGSFVCLRLEGKMTLWWGSVLTCQKTMTQLTIYLAVGLFASWVSESGRGIQSELEHKYLLEKLWIPGMAIAIAVHVPVTNNMNEKSELKTLSLCPTLYYLFCFSSNLMCMEEKEAPAIGHSVMKSPDRQIVREA